jgi:hypothetical protein
MGRRRTYRIEKTATGWRWESPWRAWRSRLIGSSIVMLAAALEVFGLKRWYLALGLWAVILTVPVGVCFVVLKWTDRRRAQRRAARRAG